MAGRNVVPIVDKLKTVDAEVAGIRAATDARRQETLRGLS